MVPFFVEIELENKPLTISAEQLDSFHDVDGYCRYDVTAGERRAVIVVNVGCEEPARPNTPQEAENYYEAIHYPEQPQAYTEKCDELFMTAELNTIARAIRQHNREAGISFPEFNFNIDL
jgi:hypothetical protein